MTEEQNQQLFAPLGDQVDGPQLVEEIESLCMNCHDDGITKLLLTRIPFFREIIVMSFECPHCGLRNAEIQPAGEIQPKGVKILFRVDNVEELNRQIVKSDTAIFRIEDLDLEIPAGRGKLTNVEGILTAIIQDLTAAQEVRKEAAPDVYEKIESIILLIKNMAEGIQVPFQLSLNDPAGNSWIEPSSSDSGGKLIKSEYNRSADQNEALGLAAEQTSDNIPVEMRPEYKPQHMVPAMPQGPISNNVDDDDIVENQVYSFPDSCPGCQRTCETNMKMVNIPHFKKVVIMATNCDQCGYKSNEVKTGGEIPDKGRKITISVSRAEDLSRDILKSEFCALSSPELSLTVEPGTLGGRFTTIEGILTQIRDDLKSNIFDLGGLPGDSMQSDDKSKWNAFFNKLDAAISGEFFPFTLELRDPIAGSYIQSLADVDGELDHALQIENYQRSQEEEEDMGLTDMKTEDYEEKVPSNGSSS